MVPMRKRHQVSAPWRENLSLEGPVQIELYKGAVTRFGALPHSDPRQVVLQVSDRQAQPNLRTIHRD